MIATKIRYDLKTDVDKLIANAVASAKTMQNKVQIAAVAILQHAYKHGDYTKANELVNGLGTGVRAVALVEWFKQYGGLVVEEGQEGFTGWSGKDHIKANFEQAKSVMWWTLKPQTPWAGFDLEAQLASLLNKARKAQERASADEADASKVSVDAELLAKLEALV